VGIDHIRRMRGDPGAHRQQAAQVLAADGQGGDGDLPLPRLVEDTRSVGADQADIVAALDHAGGFGKNPDLLSAPALRVFRMDDLHETLPAPSAGLAN
jgi:hypothetical protein